MRKGKRPTSNVQRPTSNGGREARGERVTRGKGETPNPPTDGFAVANAQLGRKRKRPTPKVFASKAPNGGREARSERLIEGQGQRPTSNGQRPTLNGESEEGRAGAEGNFGEGRGGIIFLCCVRGYAFIRRSRPDCAHDESKNQGRNRAGEGHGGGEGSGKWEIGERRFQISLNSESSTRLRPAIAGLRRGRRASGRGEDQEQEECLPILTM
jgi:hypothetical protein